MMQNIYDIPNKYVFAFYYIGALPFLIWIAFGGWLLGILSGIYMLIIGLISIIRPNIMPRFKIIYGLEITANTFMITQRVVGFAEILLAIYIFYIGRIGSTLDIGIMEILIFGSFLGVNIFYEKRHSSNSLPTTTSFVKFRTAVCIAFVILGILLIIVDIPMKKPGFPLLIGGLVGGFFGLLLQNRKSKKFLKEANSNISESQAI